MYDGAYVGRVERVLGRGAFGTVHRFRDAATGETLAMKALAARGRRPDDARLEEMLCQEAGFSFAVGTHANLVAIRRVLVPLPDLEASNLRGGALILSDVVEGRPLDAWVARRPDGPLYEGDDATIARRLAGLALQLYAGIDHMHRRGVMHQDLKPGNLVVTDAWHLKITDYGLAGYSSVRERDPWLTKSQNTQLQDSATLCAPLVGGTPAYRGRAEISRLGRPV